MRSIGGIAMRQVGSSVGRLIAIGVAVLVGLQVVSVVPPHATRSMAQSAATAVPGAPIELDARQAQEVAVLVEFFRAYNAGQVATALALFGPTWLWSDCDYRRGHVIVGKGIDSLKRWLLQRKADHDRLEIGSIYVGTLQEEALGASFRRRTNDTLRALGKSRGIVPAIAAKVIFGDVSGAVRITGFANGPYGGTQESCQVRS